MKQEKHGDGAVLVRLLAGIIFLAGSIEGARAQTVVQFPTEDGLSLYGTLHLPKNPRPPFATSSSASSWPRSKAPASCR